jgi:hypothetical protein
VVVDDAVSWQARRQRGGTMGEILDWFGMRSKRTRRVGDRVP